jgi:hypothetical protein
MSTVFDVVRIFLLTTKEYYARIASGAHYFCPRSLDVTTSAVSRHLASACILLNFAKRESEHAVTC